MKRLIAVAFALAVAVPAQAQEDDMSYFLNNHTDTTSTWDVDCFQAGNRIISEKGVRIGSRQGKLTVGNVFVTNDGYELAVVGLAETTCRLRQIGGDKPTTETERPAQ
jgi:hypothetical protein